MQINRLELENFRNYDSLFVEFSPNTNIIFGENGQGKTNILEAVYICAFGRSYRTIHEKEIIKLSKEEAHIKAEYEISKIKRRFDVHMKKNEKKGLAIDRIPVKSLKDLYGQLNLVMFSPDDLEIIKRGPSVRRNFMNLELCQIDRLYVDDLINYTKILKQRNELLKQIDENKGDRALSDTLDIWDLSLSETGKKIVKRRKKFIEEMSSLMFDVHYDISGGREKLKIRYEPQSDEDDIYENLLRSRERDRIYKNTSVGPHRDDISFIVNDKDLKMFGSQGQQRTCVLSLKLAELKIIENVKKEKPILLLDDVLSELDRKRQKELLKRTFGIQTLITCTGMDEFIEKEVGDVKKFHIRDAKITD